MAARARLHLVSPSLRLAERPDAEQRTRDFAVHAAASESTDDLAQLRPSDLRRLRRRGGVSPDLEVGGAGRSGAPFGLDGDRLAFEVEIELGSAKAAAILLKDGEGRRAMIGVDGPSRSVFVERVALSDVAPPGYARCRAAPVRPWNDRVKLQVVFDRSLLEVFVNDGERVLIERIVRADGRALWSLASTGGVTRFRNLAAWPLDPAF